MPDNVDRDELASLDKEIQAALGSNDLETALQLLNHRATLLHWTLMVPIDKLESNYRGEDK